MVLIVSHLLRGFKGHVEKISTDLHFFVFFHALFEASRRNVNTTVDCEGSKTATTAVNRGIDLQHQSAIARPTFHRHDARLILS